MATSRKSSGSSSTKRGSSRSQGGGKQDKSLMSGVPITYHAPIYIGLILLSLLVFFGGVIFTGQAFTANDNISWQSFKPFLDVMAEKGESPLWIPYIFSGMPGFASHLVTGDRWWDLTMHIIYSVEHIFGFINYPVMRVVMHYFIYGIGIFWLMRTKKLSASTAFFVSLAAIFSTWIIVYIMIGHNTKIMTLMALPFIFIFLERLIDRWSLLYAGLLLLAIHVLAEAGHIQTAFYAACAVAIYLVVELVGSLLSKQNDVAVGVIRAGLVAAVGVAFAYGMGMDRNLATQEYLPYSTRGAAAITAEPSQQGESALDVGHGYDYATEYSFSPGEMITYVVPSYFGFGNYEYEGQEVNTYWGQMPFTDAAHYMGIAVLILGLLGAYLNRRNRFVQAMIAVGLFGLLLSFGYTLPVLYDFFYNFVPGFSKFRAPSQSLMLLEFAFPILAGFGIQTLIAMRHAGDNKKVDRTILYTAIAFGVFIFVGVAGQSLIKESYFQAANQKLRQSPGALDLVYSNMTTDWLVSGFFGLATLLLIWVYLRGNITTAVLKVALISILIFDLWRIDYRPMRTEPSEKALAVFNRTDIDAFLEQDKSQYRILDLTRQPNYPAYQLQQSILGYHSAKLRNYQDLLDVAGNKQLPTSPLAWSLLNTKYIIGDQQMAEGLKPVFQSQQKKAIVFENPNAMPRAWFVNRVEVAEDYVVLEKIRDQAFDPRDVAYIADGLAASIDPVGTEIAPAPTDTTASDTIAAPHVIAAQPKGSVSITNYEALHIAMDVEAPGTNFLVISEIHYPPGWRATIDGQPADLIQTNYLLRGLVVPPGKHTIEMHYVSDGFETGKWVSLGLNLITFAFIGIGYFVQRKQKDQPEETTSEA